MAINLKWAFILGRSCYITVFNQFGFPAHEVIERCAARNIPMYRTDINGAVHAVSDGMKWTITSESDRNINAQENRGR